MTIRALKLFKLVNKLYIFFILIALQNIQWLKILRKFGSIISTYYKSPILFCRYLGYLKTYRIVSVFKICVWISVFRRKKRLVNPLHYHQVTAILVIQENSGLFFETPCIQLVKASIYLVSSKRKQKQPSYCF